MSGQLIKLSRVTCVFISAFPPHVEFKHCVVVWLFVAATIDVDRVAFIAFLSQPPAASSHSLVNSLPRSFLGSSAADLAAPEKMAKFGHAKSFLASRTAKRLRDISRIIASSSAAISYPHTVPSSIQPLLQEPRIFASPQPAPKKP